MSNYYSNRKRITFKKVMVGIAKVFLVVYTTVLLLFAFVILAVFILLKGPSKEATRLFTLSAHETSAMKWVPSVFLSEEEYSMILNPNANKISDEANPMMADQKVIVPFKTADFLGNGTVTEVTSEEEVSIDENLPELEIVDLLGPTYKGKLMIIRDPSRVQIASIDSFGDVGWTLSQFLEKYNAIACTNAGGFEDENGKGKGGIPDGLVIKDGQIVYGSAGGYYKDVVGFDANNKLIVGNMSGQEAINCGLVNATSFETGPVLIKDGQRQTGFVSGINPRTCIGQSADGTVLLIAIEGRMADSLGATFDDLVDILEQYGAVNAGNLDGGSSSGMYYEGERITRSCSVIGDRPLPTAVIVSR